MALTGDDILLVERDVQRRCALVTVNREERGNAISLELAARLSDLWPELRDDDAVASVILTGAGVRFFSTGNDLKDAAELGDGLVAAIAATDVRITPAEHGVWKPVIAAVNGAALAGGFFLAQMCDVRLAADTATFGIPEVRWSMPAPFAAELQHLLAPAVARELALWGSRRLGARRLYELGFVNQVVPAGDLLDVARAWAADIADLPPLAVQAHKQLMHETLVGDVEGGGAGWPSAAPTHAVAITGDAIDGARAFAARRSTS